MRLGRWEKWEVSMVGEVGGWWLVRWEVSGFIQG